MAKKTIVQKMKDAVGLGDAPEAPAPEAPAPEAPAPEAPVAKTQKHNRAEIIQMEHYLNMLSAPHATDALKLFHRIIND